MFCVLSRHVSVVFCILFPASRLTSLTCFEPPIVSHNECPVVHTGPKACAKIRFPNPADEQNEESQAKSPISVLSEFCIQYSAVHGILWVFATPTLGGRWAGNMSPRHQHKFTACSRPCLCKNRVGVSGRQHVLHVAALFHHIRPTKNKIVQWIHFLDCICWLVLATLKE